MNKASISALSPLIFSTVLEVLTSAVRQENKIKVIEQGEKIIGDIIFLQEKNCRTKNRFRKVTGYRIKISCISVY